MTHGVAHISFSGGGMFLPARNPYDKQVLAEHVLSRVHAKGQVQVLLENQRWMVYRRPEARAAECAHCAGAVDSPCYLAAGDGSPFCVRCAFGDVQLPADHVRPVVRRRMRQ